MSKVKRISISDLNQNIVQDIMRTDGCFILEKVLSEDFIKRANGEIIEAIEKESQWHGNKTYTDYGMILLCSLYSGVFWELLENPSLMKPFNYILGDGCIVYAYTSSSMPPKDSNYSSRLHVDCPRIIPNYVTNMGATIAISDFTVENGATLFLPKSHEMAEEPTLEDFVRNAESFVVPAGSVMFFNARIWHMGGVNKTTDWRHAITINMCRSYMRQRIDIPRAMEAMNLDKMSDTVKQKLGFHVRIPSNLTEYYLPKEQRTFKQKVE